MNDKSKGAQKIIPTPERILGFLSESPGWRSGEEMAERLGITRAAVAKQVAKLRIDGNVIESQTKRGYCLRVLREAADRYAVEPHLRTTFLGRTGWLDLRETVSTNTEAITWALAGAAAGAVVTAERQNGGKGRKGRNWFSSPHSLQFSVILRPQGVRETEASITTAALFAAAEAIRSMVGVEPVIKQPNDVMLDGRKVCGILTEAGSRAGEPDWVALGIGCNVNVVPGEFPEELRERMTSLYQLAGTQISKSRLFAEILNRLEIGLLELGSRSGIVWSWPDGDARGNPDGYA